MSLLHEIHNKVLAESNAEEPWLVLRNTYFREGNGWDAMKVWANTNGLQFTFAEVAGSKDLIVRFTKKNAL